MTKSDRRLRIDRSRLERVLEVIAQATIGNYDGRVPINEHGEAAPADPSEASGVEPIPPPDAESIEAPGFGPTDPFVELEVALNMLLEELEVTRSRSREQNREIERQASQLAQQHIELVRALSIPIIVVWPGVLALPIIGAVDAERAAQMSEAMLLRVVAERASHVILDLTGAAAIQAETARSLLRMATAVRMLGSRCLLTGISPEMARTLVELDFDAASLQTLPQLSDGLLRVLAEKGQRLIATTPPRGPAR